MPRYLTYKDLDAIAARVIRAYCRLPEIQNKYLISIDPTVLVSKLLGLKIEYRHLSDDGKTLGLTCFEELGIQFTEQEDEWFQFDGKTVLIEEMLRDDPEQYGRRNFTIIHEGGHHILKMLFPEDYELSSNAFAVLHYREGRNSSSSREEWQVNTLTSAILMPEFLLNRGMDIVGLTGKIEILNSIWRREEYDKFCKLAFLLGVSKQALSIRMKNLGLIGRDYLADPKEIMNVCSEEGELYD